jgi:hypothetical protein
MISHKLTEDKLERRGAPVLAIGFDPLVCTFHDLQ